MQGKNSPIKIGVALVVLGASAVFSISRMSGGGGAKTSSSETTPESSPTPTTASSAPAPFSSSALQKEEPKPNAPDLVELSAKPITWEQYLEYDPFADRKPNPELAAMAKNGKSPFYSEESMPKPSSGPGGPGAVNPGNNSEIWTVVDPSKDFTLTAILSNRNKEVAIINGKPYQEGEYLVKNADKAAAGEEDDYAFRIVRILSNGVKLRADGAEYELYLVEPEQISVRPR